MATEEGRAELQDALTKLEHWADRWGMEFNISKCKVMHFGRNNPRHDYRMKGRLLEKTEEERDLGVMTMASAKPAAQCAKAARTGPHSPSRPWADCPGLPLPGLGNFPRTLPPVYQTPPGIFSPSLGTMVPKRQGAAGERPKKSQKDDFRAKK